MLSRKILLALLFLEGASVMFVEIAVARIISPYYGASLTTWASILGVTMSSLAFGYLLGGKWADRVKHPEKLLLNILFATAITTLLLPYFGKVFMFAFLGLPIEINTVLLSIILLSPSLILFGTIPQITIKILTQTNDNSGKTTGFTYALSTIGGIIGTLLTGFLIVPTYGISIPLFVASFMLVTLPFWYLGVKNKSWAIFVYVPLFLFVIKDYKKTVSYQSRTISIKEYSEGLLGQLLVADYPYQENGKIRHNRMLMINRMAESTIDPQTGEVIFGEYIHVLMKAIDPVPNNSDVLLLGLGGGSLMRQFNKREFNADVCELDQRIADAAFKFFGIKKDFKLFIDDARHYLNTCKKKYDLIVFDVFKGENPPAYLLSKENFNQLKALLKPQGMIVINFNGFLTGEIGKGCRSVIKTISSCGYNVRLFSSKANEDERNSIIVASNHEIDYAPYQNSKVYASLYTGQFISDIRDYEIPISSIDTADAFVLTDNKPILDIINRQAAKAWRDKYNQYYTNIFFNQGIPMFK